MTQRKNRGKYEECVNCGANLDHGERCGCQDTEAQSEEQKEEKKPNS